MLIGIIMLSLISLNYFQTVELESYSSTVDLIENCKSAEAILLSEHKSLKPDTWIRMIELEDSTFYQVKHWGIWNIGSVKSKRRKEVISNAFVFGDKWNNNGTAIQLKNGISGLSISGRTKLTGNVFVPGGRVKPAYIEGQSFNGDQLVSGSVSETPRNFPRISTQIKNKLKALRTDQFTTDSIVKYHESIDVEAQDFTDKKLVLTSVDSIAILQKSISGNVVIKSNRAIYISPFATLENVICIAPRIYVGTGFNGRIQCIATQKIEIAEEVVLSYPSSLCLLSEKEKRASITLEKNSQLEGVLILTNELGDRTPKILKVGRDAKVTGQVICEASTEIRGTVFGQVITHDFSLKTPSASYKNHLLNAEINSSKLPDWFSGVSLEGEQGKTVKISDL